MMKRMMIVKLAASSMVIGATLTGCFGGGGSVASVSEKAVAAKDGPKYAAKAVESLEKGKIDKAVAEAEAAVAAVPHDAGYRALLGHTYMQAGRFASAERSFMDAIELGDTQGKTALSLAMVQLGMGKSEKALNAIRANRANLPASDYGLALALAGEAQEGVDVLSHAIRSDNVGARTRQNLALAYALSGRWNEAKVMAMQDMDPAGADQRIMQWAQMARPGAYETRVAGLLGVTPVAADPGQPIRLALNQAPVMTAEQDYNVEVASFDEQAPLPAIGPAPRGDSPIARPVAPVAPVGTVEVPVSAATPLIKASAEPARIAPERDYTVEAAKTVAKPEPVAAPVKVAAAPVAPAPAPKPVAVSAPVEKPPVVKAAFEKPVAAPAASSNGTYLVQLGAFSSPENAKRGWDQLSARHSSLKGFQYASAKINAKGKTLYRLAAIGFGNASSAEALCAGIKASGGNCIVRHVKGVNPSQMAAKKPTQVASR